MKKIQLNQKKLIKGLLLVLVAVLVFAVGYAMAVVFVPKRVEVVNLPVVEEIFSDDDFAVETILEPAPAIFGEGLALVVSEKYVGDPITWLEQRERVSSEEEQAEYLLEKVGVVNQGQYQGWSVLLQTINQMGSPRFHVIQKEPSSVLTTEALLASDQLLVGLYDYPDSVKYASYDFVESGGYLMPNEEVTDFERKIQIDGRDFLIMSNGCLAFERKDHLVTAFSLSLPFIDPENRLADIVFDDGKKNQDSYTYIHLTCGYFCFPLTTVFEEELQPDDRLKVVGHFSTGETLYEIKDSEDAALKELYQNKMTIAYAVDEERPTGSVSKYSYDEFLSYHPLLYWKGPLDQWIEFRNDRFAIAAEMCKPVIYLYPEQTTDLSVRVFPNGGFTYTEPEYGQGWKVTANPNGEIIDSSGVSYPYLFWEGVGLHYPEPKGGFVVKSEDLESFLNDKLTLLGLRNRELEDFKEYWLGRLVDLEKPYFKISFLKKSEIDALSPLVVGPERPQTIIRIMMTVVGLDVAEDIEKQILTAVPERRGFTVVEWGGTVFNE